jgi:hypothetical protein
MNNLTAFNPEIWSRTMQILHKQMAHYRQVANFRGESELKHGDVFHRPLPGSTFVQRYTPGSDMIVQGISATDETLTVTKNAAATFAVDDVEKVQSQYDIMAQFSKDAVTNITNIMDADFQAEALNAASVIDARDFGGSEAPIALTSNNVFDVHSKVFEKLADQNVELSEIYGMITPQEWAIINSAVAGRDTSFGDDVTRNGFKGNMVRYNGIDEYLTTNYTSSLLLDLPVQPSNGETVVFSYNSPTGTRTITLTFVSSIGATAGNVLIGGNVDATRANAAALINNPGVTSATQVGFTGEALHDLLLKFSAVNNDTADTLRVYYRGGKLSGTETLAGVGNAFNAGQAIKHLMFGRKKAVDMIVPIQPLVKQSDIPLQFGMYIKSMSRYGLKTFNDGAKQLVEVRLKLV